jgi:3-phosphoshikimate 1-carboxyvinyltransferase
MAMSLAPLALVCGQITILHPEVVAKSYPGFWEDLRSAGFPVEFGKKANRHGATGQR